MVRISPECTLSAKFLGGYLHITEKNQSTYSLSLRYICVPFHIYGYVFSVVPFPQFKRPEFRMDFSFLLCGQNNPYFIPFFGLRNGNLIFLYLIILLKNMKGIRIK